MSKLGCVVDAKVGNLYQSKLITDLHWTFLGILKGLLADTV